MVARTRTVAEAEIYRRLAGLLTPERRSFLDGLLVVDEGTHRTPLAWLRSVPGSNSPEEILDVLEKLRVGAIIVFLYTLSRRSASGLR